MEKLKNVIKNLKDKISSKGQKVVDVEEEITEPEEDLVIVSDFAIALGAKFNEPTGDEVHDHFRWINREALKPKYRQTEDGKERSAYYVQEAEDMQPEIHDFFAKHFKIKGSYLVYNDEYVSFPQKRVNQELNAYLTALAVDKTITLPESEFGKIDYQVQPYAADISRGIQTSSYYFQGQPYCLRVDPGQKHDQYQWYQISPVMAQYTPYETIKCDDVLLADFSYNEKKFVTDLKNSTEFSQVIPMLYTKTPWQKNQEQTADKSL